ncbi:hypothetical protein ABZ470_31810 [Streptosporangium sp. NPDC020072]|uniref:hypothetical protein n=1 Tax=Streptosporangium sp. NPDC020072 TaxID=3154788 RepID=UPI00344996B5
MGKRGENIVIVLKAGFEYGVGKMSAEVCVQNNGIAPSHNEGILLNPMMGGHSDWERKYGHLANLRAKAFLDRNGKAAYGWSVEYADPGTVLLADAEIMVKTLRRTDRVMGHLAKEFGTPDSFGQFVAHFAASLGCTRFAVRHATPQPDGTYYKWLDTNGMLRWVASAETGETA